MRKAMEKWLHKRQIAFDPNTAKTICDRFGLEGEKSDVCFALCYQLENGGIAEAEFTGGLCVLTGKEPEEVMGVLRGVKGTCLKMTLDELDKKAVALYTKRHGREAYESGEIGETLERIEQRAEEYDPVFLSRHPELKGKSITVYHDPLAGEDWAVVNNETGEVVETFDEEVMGMLKGEKPVKRVAVIGREAEEAKVTKGLIKAIEASKEAVPEVTPEVTPPVTPEVMGVLKGVTPEGEYVRVTIKEEGKMQTSFWAKKGEETRLGNLYTRVNKEGRDFSEYKIIEGEEILVEKKYLISRSLIVKEEPAHIDRTYGTMKIGKLPPPPIEVAIPKAEGD